MLDLQQLHAQFDAFNRYQSREQALLEQKVWRALEALHDCGPAWEALRDRVERSRPEWLVAGQIMASAKRGVER